MLFRSRSEDKLLDSSTMIIKSYRDIAKYKEVKNMLNLDYTDPQVMSLITELTVERALASPDKGRLEELQTELDKLRENVPEIKCIIDPEFEETLLEDGYTFSKNGVTQVTKPKSESKPHALSFEELVEKALAGSQTSHNGFEEDPHEEPESDYQKEDAISKLVDKAMTGKSVDERVNFTERNVIVEAASSDVVEKSNDSSVDASVDPNPCFTENLVPVQRKNPQPVPDPERLAPPVTEEIEGLDEEEPIEPIEEEIGDEKDGAAADADDYEDGEDDDEEEIGEDVVGEPASELDSAVEEDLPSAPEESKESSFITEPVVDDGPTDDLPLEVAEAESELADPETVVIDDAYLASDKEDIGEEEEDTNG